MAKKIWKTSKAREKSLRKSARRQLHDALRARFGPKEKLDRMNASYLGNKTRKDIQIISSEIVKYAKNPWRVVPPRDVKILFAEAKARENLIPQFFRRSEEILEKVKLGTLKPDDPELRRIETQAKALLSTMSRAKKAIRNMKFETDQTGFEEKIETALKNASQRIAMLETILQGVQILKRQQ